MRGRTEGAAESGEGGAPHRLVDHDELDGGAPLAVVREAAGGTRGGGDVEVGVGQDDAHVLALELSEDLELRGRGVLRDDRVAAAGATDEAEHVDQPRLHDRAHRLAPRATDEVDHAGGERGGERVGCRRRGDAQTRGQRSGQ